MIGLVRASDGRRRRSSLVALWLVAPLVAWIAVVASQASPDTQSQSQPTTLEPVPADCSPSDAHQPWRYVGISSCAAAACHGGTLQDPTPPDRTRENRSAYRVWAERDKHANAYEVLFRNDAKEMARRLGPPLDPNHMDGAKLCLACHSTTLTNSSSAISQEDGVSCEACHGPASEWKNQHWLESWKTKTPAQKQKMGMNDLRGDLVTRAKVCVDCHVGSPDKEVNHDLIAAGHPRLNFEFAAFHDLVPRHWNDAQDRAFVSRQTGAPFDAALWVVGQVATAKAAAGLLAARVQRISAKPNEQPWPELSEYDCYACHHPLVDNSWRQVRSRLPRDGGKPGMLRPSSWYFAMLGPIREQLPWKDEIAFTGAMPNEGIARLDQPTPNLAQIRAAEETLAALERRLSASPEGRSLNLSREQIKLLLDHVTGIQLDRQITTDWDQVAQAYLAAVPLQAAFREASGQDRYKGDPRVTEKLEQILRALEFPTNTQSPPEAQWGDHGGASNGRSAIELLKELRELVERPTNSWTNP